MEIALGLFLNVLFWAVVVSVVVIAFVRYGAGLFPGRRRRGKKAPSQASLTEKTEAERHGKAAWKRKGVGCLRQPPVIGPPISWCKNPSGLNLPPPLGIPPWRYTLLLIHNGGEVGRCRSDSMRTWRKNRRSDWSMHLWMRGRPSRNGSGGRSTTISRRKNRRGSVARGRGGEGWGLESLPFLFL